MPFFHQILLLAFLLPGALTAQAGVFPVVDVDSRLQGGTGLAASGLAALWTNPAGYAAQAVGGFGAAAGGEQRFGVKELLVANAGAVYGTDFGGFGIQVASFGFDAYRENRIGIGYGRKLTDKLSLGADFNAFTTATEGYASTFDITFGLGLQYELSEQISLGSRLFSPIRTERLPGEFLPQVLAIGLAYQPSETLTFNLEAEQNPEYPLRFRAGMAYLPNDKISILAGVVTNMSELTFGLGYEIIPQLKLTAGSTWHEVLGLSPVFGVSYLPK